MSNLDCYYLDIEKLYQENRGPLHGFLKKQLGNHADADECVQEVFRLYIERVQKDNNGYIEKPRSYLYTIARNVCNDRLRENGKLAKGFDADEQILNKIPIDEATIPIDESRLQRKEFRQIFSHLWEELTEKFTPRQKKLICMHVIKEMSIKEMANALGTDIETVRRETNAAQSRLNYRVKLHLKGISRRARAEAA